MGKKPPFDPYAAGLKAVEILKAADGGAFTEADILKKGITSVEIQELCKAGAIVVWRDNENKEHFPKWQFTEQFKVMPGIQKALDIFKSTDQWRIMAYFLGRRVSLGNKTPLKMLQMGLEDQMLKHAQFHFEENTW